MTNNVAAQQIAGLLTQAGIPAPHSLDVAQRLLSMANTGSAGAANQGVRSYDSTSANNSTFQNRYRSRDSNGKDGAAGRAGKDGLPGYGQRGVDGKDGMQGIPGTPGTIDWDAIKSLIDEMIAAAISEALAAFETRLLTQVLNCNWFRKKASECLDVPGGGPAGGCPKCCSDDRLMVYKNKDICSILYQHFIQIQQIKKRLDAIEKDLKNTTTCEA